ncbi:glycosyltransferase family 2 protein [Turicibacter sanguinis]|uniref:glycosyltransferase family 2 protein n=1 Tax=Turicibacter sanguinis TaxID=154288 RepID=UPI0010495CC2|nr:glycosyltransferase [Turicibacter sanguinis]MCU7212138.1 glycosyltransferase [Turicibacter sanguinis]QJS18081.1 glycosyltransferase [Turicibacter sanguinis]
MKLPVVSIVVPIYNVENYVRKCIDSIISQTYQNIEIILVNDGSTDQSGQIISSYLEVDKRIRIFHKENGGLSDARNYGMRYITGEYVLFVDSDDWIDKSFVESLVNVSLIEAADIVQCGFYYTYDECLEYDNRWFNENDPYYVLNHHEAMKELIQNERIKNFAWGKLFKASLLHDIPFEKGVLFEDIFWMHQVFARIEKYVLIHQPLYFYRQRMDSIVAQYRIKNLDLIRGQIERKEFVVNYYPSLISEQDKIIVQSMLIHFNLLSMNETQDREKVYRTKLKDYLRMNQQSLFESIKNDRRLYWQLKIFLINPNLLQVERLINYSLRKIGIIEDYKELKKISFGG